MEVQNKVINWVKSTKGDLVQQHEISLDTQLLQDGLLDSLDFLQMVTYIEDEFQMRIPVVALTPENFSTPRSISALVENLRSAAA